MAHTLVLFLRNHPNIGHMCHSPLHLAMVAYLHECECGLPDTETDLYVTYTLQILYQALEREVGFDELDDLEFHEIGDLPEGKMQVFNDICYLAFVYTVQLEAASFHWKGDHNEQTATSCSFQR